MQNSDKDPYNSTEWMCCDVIGTLCCRTWHILFLRISKHIGNNVDEDDNCVQTIVLQVNLNILRIKKVEYRDGIKKGDKIGMGPLHSSDT